MTPAPESVLSKPLVFGCREQIDALKKEQEKAEYEEIPKCDQCDGTGECLGECPECGHETEHCECEKCDGTGKNLKSKEAEEFIRDHRSQDPVQLNVEVVREDQCSRCGALWETYEESPGIDACASCGASVKHQSDTIEGNRV